MEKALHPIEIVVAVANKRVIGNGQTLPWGYIPEDMEHFKNITMGSYVVMGCRTLESICKNSSQKRLQGGILPGRTIFVLSRCPEKAHSRFPGCIAISDINAILKLRETRRVCIAGGQEVYEQFIVLPEIRVVHLTRIFADFPGDVFFPELHINEWQLRKNHMVPGDIKKGVPSIAFQTFIRNPRN